MIGLLSPSVVLSLSLTAAIWLALGRPRARSATRWLLLFAFLVAVVAESSLLVWQVLFTAGALWFCRAVDLPVSVRRGAACAATVAAVGLFTYGGIADARRFEADLAILREQYPMQSLGDRLAYETRRAPTGADVAAAAPAKLAPEVERALQEAELSGQMARRGRALAQLYQSVDDPATRAGGYRRSAFGLFSGVFLPTARSISVSEPPSRRGCEAPETPAIDYGPTPEPSDSTAPLAALADVHRAASRDFLDPKRFGYVADREHVAGFESHAFSAMPDYAAHQSPAGALSLEHLDLVSLQRPAGPHVYVSHNLPKLDELQTADTRLLDDFETRALARLRTDEDVVVEEVDGVVRMLGALRAGNHCTRCHSAGRGELIGALSYELHRKTPATQIAQQ